MDNMQYNYPTTSNQLKSVSEGIASGNWSTDIDHQATTNYSYNAIGQLTKDETEGIKTIDWNLQGLAKQVIKINGDTLNFSYNTLHQRVKKELFHSDSVYQTLYSYYADGKIAAIYEKKYKKTKEAFATIKVKELSMTGLSRVGVLTVDATIQIDSALSHTYARQLKNKMYEVTDQLGDVKLTLTDELNTTYKSGSLKTLNTKIKTANNYYAYGMQQPGRFYSSTNYRYGVQGKESDDELKGDGNSYDFGARILDPRIARWLSTDPLENKYPEFSPYVSMADNPVNCIDPDGRQTTTLVHEQVEYGSHPGAKQGDRSPDGNAVYIGTAEYGAFVTIPSEKELREYTLNIGLGIARAKAGGYNHAANNFKRWLDGEGGTFQEDPNWIRRSEYTKKAMEVNFQRFLEDSKTTAGVPIEKAMYGMEDGQTIFVNDYWDRVVEPSWSSTKSESDLYYSWGNYTITSRANLSISREGDNLRVTGTIVHTFKDSYDWNLGSGIPLPIGKGVYVDDSSLRIVEALNGAKPFTGTASWTENVDITFEYNSYPMFGTKVFITPALQQYENSIEE